MIFLSDALGFTLMELREAVERKEITERVHPDIPELSIFNYTPETQYRNFWNNITLSCRGLIVNTRTEELVARPWEKFFNFGQRDNRIESTAPVEITDKMDGSLGILYTVTSTFSGRPREWRIATRGSFDSHQARHATRVWENKYEGEVSWNAQLNSDTTFLFEIVYPSNRIVVNYGDMDDLVLLGAVDKINGYYMGPSEAKALLGWTGPVTETFQSRTFVEALSLNDRPGKEGYVIRSGSKIVKLKQQDYLDLHRIVTNLNPKAIWEMLGKGRSIEDICADIPDEFHGYVEEHGAKMLSEANEIAFQAMREFSIAKGVILDRHENPTRGDYARLFKKKNTYPNLSFLLLDDKPIHDVVWKMVKPKGDIAAVVADEGE